MSGYKAGVDFFKCVLDAGHDERLHARHVGDRLQELTRLTHARIVATTGEAKLAGFC